MKITTSFQVLMQYAKEEADAKKSGNAERIKEATEAHEDYRQKCLKSDEMKIGMTYGEISECMKGKLPKKETNNDYWIDINNGEHQYV